MLRTCVAFLAIGLLLAVLPQPAHAQLPGSGEATPDSVAERLGLPEGHAPRGALRRALMVPGWGQYYNRQYWKIPVVAAGLGGVLFALVYSWDRYFLYRDAWRYRRVGGTFKPPGETYGGAYGGEKYKAAYSALVDQLPSVEPGQGLPRSVKRERQRFRKWGEFAVLGTGVFWILQVADAYVSAHLLGFEVRENLSMRVVPHREGLAAQVHLSF